jgi:epoxyqueuosine reductase
MIYLVEVKMQNQAKNPAQWLEKIIKDFINLSPENTLKNQANDKAWDEPLIGFAGGNDPIFQAYKEHVGPFHWTPLELFHLTFPHQKVEAGELTVIGWILPHTAKTRSELRKEKALPPESWVRARIFGEEVNVKLRRYVTANLEASGIDAVAPMLSPQWHWKTVDPEGKFPYASVWSERHAAYAAGLGTFSLSGGLITERGQSMRCGSVVARIRIPPSPRHYKEHCAYCLFFSHGGICGQCMKNCPVGAISRSGRDKVKCMKYLEVTKQYASENFGFVGYGCGFCQSGVPCESRIPSKEDLAGGR